MVKLTDRMQEKTNDCLINCTLPQVEIQCTLLMLQQLLAQLMHAKCEVIYSIQSEQLQIRQVLYIYTWLY